MYAIGFVIIAFLYTLLLVVVCNRKGRKKRKGEAEAGETVRERVLCWMMLHWMCTAGYALFFAGIGLLLIGSDNDPALVVVDGPSIAELANNYAYPVLILSALLFMIDIIQMIMASGPWAEDNEGKNAQSRDE